MKRREFLKSVAIAGAGLSLCSVLDLITDTADAATKSELIVASGPNPSKTTRAAIDALQVDGPSFARMKGLNDWDWEALLRFCDQVVLNVRADNPPALAAYRRLGYQVNVQFEERLIHRTEMPWSGWSGTLRRIFARKES